MLSHPDKVFYFKWVESSLFEFIKKVQSGGARFGYDEPIPKPEQVLVNIFMPRYTKDKIYHIHELLYLFLYTTYFLLLFIHNFYIIFLFRAGQVF